MKVEIKKISIKDVFFSVFPLAVFVLMLMTACLEVFKPEATLTVSYLMGLVMYAIQGTILFLVSISFKNFISSSLFLELILFFSKIFIQ